MYYLKILVSVFIVTLKYSVFCEDDSDDIRVNILRSTLRNYKFNHPPSIPSYQPIPVAIVYEESPRQDKTADLKASTTTKTNFVPKNISKITNFGSKDSDSSTSTANTNKENGVASTTNQPNAITLPVNTETKNVFGEKVEVGKDSILNDSKEYQKDNEQNKGPVTSKIEIKPKNKQIKARIVGGNEIQIPVAIVYEEPRIIRKKIRVRNRVNQERVRGFTLKKIDETPPITYRPVSSTTNDATTFRVGTKFTIKQESQKPEIQSIEHETSTKTINEESKTATPKTSENTSTPKSGKRRRERDPLVALIVSQQTEIQSTKHETSTKRINEERKTATPKTSENTSTPKIGKRRRERDPLVPLIVSQQTEIQSTKHETSTKRINEERTTATPKTSENTGTPKIGKRRRERDPLIPLIVSQQTEIQSTKHETSTKRINEERTTATPKTSENTGTPKIGKHRRERDPLVPLIVSQQTEIQSTKHETSTKRISEERKTATPKNSENTSTPKSVKRRRERDPVVPIIESENRVYSHAGAYKYSYEGGDGTKAFSEGELRTFDEDRTGEAVVGGFSYKDKDGNDYSLTYTADENGYRPVGAHLPTPPPIPPAIARALLYLATKTTPEPVTEAVKFQSLI